MTASKLASTPENPPRRVLLVVFITLLLDLVGFSIIFPLYPAMLLHYLENEPDGLVIGAVLQAVEALQTLAGGGALHSLQDAALFGGVLGSAYAGLQFLCTPIAGRLSDRLGRRPVLLFCIGGMAVSYGLWLFAGAFWVLVLSRLLGGVMSANIATASAAVADVTEGPARTRGMALVGVAFGIGFILGPALGGGFSLIDLTALFPGLVAYGINPFSMPALVALVLTLANLMLVWLYFGETLPEGDRRTTTGRRPIFQALQGGGVPGSARINWAWFLYQVAFAGTTFALPFHAAQQLGYGPAQITLLLVFMGLVLAVMQGGYVRRMSTRISPKLMLLHGMGFVLPALAIIGFAQTPLAFYAGLLLLGIGAAQVQPCCAALASLYAPAQAQGRAMGDFRSLGSLGRVVGPILIALAYWRVGPSASFLAGALFVAVPLVLATRLPALPEDKPVVPPEPII